MRADADYPCPCADKPSWLVSVVASSFLSQRCRLSYLWWTNFVRVIAGLEPRVIINFSHIHILLDCMKFKFQRVNACHVCMLFSFAGNNEERVSSTAFSRYTRLIRVMNGSPVICHFPLRLELSPLQISKDCLSNTWTYELFSNYRRSFTPT